MNYVSYSSIPIVVIPALPFRAFSKYMSNHAGKTLGRWILDPCFQLGQYSSILVAQKPCGIFLNNPKPPL